MDNVWIGGNDANDAHILKFTRSGQFLLQLGKPEQNAGQQRSRELLARREDLDRRRGERGVRRRRLRQQARRRARREHGRAQALLGRVRQPPDDTDLGPYDPGAPPAQQFRNPVHCAEPSRDGFVYVCDRVNDRIQVFRKDGTFVSELRVAPETRGAGSVWDIAFSHDPGQAYIYLADGVNERVYIIDRETMQILTSFGDGGRQPGQFFGVHSIADDSQGNIYTTETYEGKRVQKFVFRGLAADPGRIAGRAVAAADSRERNHENHDAAARCPAAARRACANARGGTLVAERANGARWIKPARRTASRRRRSSHALRFVQTGRVYEIGQVYERGMPLGRHARLRAAARAGHRADGVEPRALQRRVPRGRGRPGRHAVRRARPHRRRGALRRRHATARVLQRLHDGRDERRHRACGSSASST